MNLMPVPTSHWLGAELAKRGFRRTLGNCVAQRPKYHFDVQVGTTDCGRQIPDDGNGYADLDGAPFRAYVCASCAAEIASLKVSQS